MSDIRIRNGAKGKTYQVRYATPATESGYAYKTFLTRKAALEFREDSRARQSPGHKQALRVFEAVDRWLDICEKIGRDGREKVEPETLKEYRRRADVMKAYPWTKLLHELAPADVVHLRNWLLEHRSRDLARRTLSSFHSVVIEMKQQGFLEDDPAAGITIRSDGRYEIEYAEIEIPSDRELKDILAATETMAAKNSYMKERWARYRPMIYLAAFSGMRPSE